MALSRTARLCPATSTQLVDVVISFSDGTQITPGHVCDVRAKAVLSRLIKPYQPGAPHDAEIPAEPLGIRTGFGLVWLLPLADKHLKLHRASPGGP